MARNRDIYSSVSGQHWISAVLQSVRAIDMHCQCCMKLSVSFCSMKPWQCNFASMPTNKEHDMRTQQRCYALLCMSGRRQAAGMLVREVRLLYKGRQEGAQCFLHTFSVALGQLTNERSCMCQVVQRFLPLQMVLNKCQPYLHARHRRRASTNCRATPLQTGDQTLGVLRRGLCFRTR